MMVGMAPGVDDEFVTLEPPPPADEGVTLDAEPPPDRGWVTTELIKEGRRPAKDPDNDGHFEKGS